MQKPLQFNTPAAAAAADEKGHKKYRSRKNKINTGWFLTKTN